MRDELVDGSFLPLLARELGGDIAACRRFVDDFVAAWEPRRDRVLRAVGQPGDADGLAALLTLSTSSAMLGARALSAVALRVYGESRALGVVPAAAADELITIGTASVAALQDAVDRWQATAAQPATSIPVSR